MEKVDRMTPVVEKMRAEGISEQEIVSFLIKSYNNMTEMFEQLLTEVI